MQDWLQELWRDLAERTVLYPVELVAIGLCWMCAQIPWVANLRAPRAIRWFRTVANHRLGAVTLVFVLSLAGSAGLDKEEFPPPGVHDEFSYLLAGETFAQGRLTNPPHPMGRFFESFHTLQEPTYMSMYPPGQGMFLALGIALTGEPAWGVRIATALLIAALCWMLQGWVTPSWALAGALIAMMRIAWFSYWSHSYWGGAVPAIGGALLLGATGRILKGAGSGLVNGAILGSGVFLLMNTRMWEGAIASMCALLWLGWAGLRQGRKVLLPWMAAFGCVILAGAGWMAYYNWRITGSPLRPPYLENRAKYQIHGSFIWEAPNFERSYNFPELRRFYVDSEGYTEKVGFWTVQADKPKRAWHFFVGPALTLVIVGLWGFWTRQRLWLPLCMIGAFFLSHLLVRWHLQPHYAGPIVGAGYLVLVESLRRLRTWNRSGWLAGRGIAHACIAACVLMVSLRLVAPVIGVQVYQEFTNPWYSYGLLSNFHRQKVERALNAQPGKHLVLVQYNENHRPDLEWVYNHADVDGASIVWARYVRDRDTLAPLLEYYKDRKVWWINPDESPTRVVDYRDILLQGTLR